MENFLLNHSSTWKTGTYGTVDFRIITKYNDFVTPLIYLNDPEKYTIQIALDFLSVAVQDKAAIASAGVFSIVPMLMLYIIFQKRIIDGISLSSGLKG